MHVVDDTLLNEWINTSKYRRAMDWIINGRIIYDRNEYFQHLKEELRIFPAEKRKLKLAIEFAKLTRSYSESKDLYESGHYLDSYSRLLRSLHYLGRIAIIEKGYHPEVMVWGQVKRIDPEVYKLYEELIRSQEETKKRVELMLLAIEFALSSRSTICSEHLLDVMKEKDGPWGFRELKVHPKLRSYLYDLSSMVAYLVDKNVIDVILVETKGEYIFHRKYVVK